MTRSREGAQEREKNNLEDLRLFAGIKDESGRKTRSDGARVGGKIQSRKRPTLRPDRQHERTVTHAFI